LNVGRKQKRKQNKCNIFQRWTGGDDDDDDDDDGDRDEYDDVMM